MFWEFDFDISGKVVFHPSPNFHHISGTDLDKKVRKKTSAIRSFSNQELKNEMNYFWKKYDDTYSNRHDSCNQYSSCRYIFGFPGQMVLLRGY